IGCYHALSPFNFQFSVASSTPPAAPAAMSVASVPEIPALAAPVELETAAAKPVALTDEDGEEADDVTVADNTPNYPRAKTLTVKNGDTLINLLTDAGVTHDEAYNLVESVRKVYDPKKLDVGQNVAVKLDKTASSQTPVVASLVLPLSL